MTPAPVPQYEIGAGAGINLVDFESPITLNLVHGGETREYTFLELIEDKTGREREARGICVSGISSRAGGAFPERLFARFPDLAGLDEAKAERYIQGFNQEVKTECELLKKVTDDNTIAKPLGGRHYTIDYKGGEANILLCVIPHGAAALGSSVQTLRQSAAALRRMSLKVWFEIAEDLIKMVHRLHLQGVRHGYICPDNIIVGRDFKNPILINLEWDTPDPTLRMKPADLTHERMYCWRRPYDAPDKICYPRDESETGDVNNPFAPDDIFSLGLTLLFLAKKNYEKTRDQETLHPFKREERWKAGSVTHPWNRIIEPYLRSNENIKSEVRSSLEHAFDGEKDEEIIAATEVVFACLRTSAHLFHNARGILEVYQRFRSRSGEDTPTGITTTEHADSMVMQLTQSLQLGNPVLEFLYLDRLKQCIFPAQGGTNKRFTVGRSRDEIVDALCGLLLEVKEGWECHALLTPSFWFEENCGPDGRVVSALRIAAKRGCSIKILLIMREQRMNVPEVTHVMNHIRKWDWAKGKRWIPKRDDEFQTFQREERTFIALSPPSGNCGTISIPDFASENGPVIALRISDFQREEFDSISGDFNGDKWEKALKMDQYMHR